VDPAAFVSNRGSRASEKRGAGSEGQIDSITQVSQKIYGLRAYPSHPESGTMFPSNATPMAR
jgi:hypothetical protein